MNYFDIVAGIILIIALVRGYKNGLVIELASLTALVLGVLGAIKFSGLTEEWLMQHISVSYIGLIAFIITFAGIVIAVHLIAKAIDKLITAVALGFLNRVFGALFSFVKYAFVLSIIMAIFSSFDRTFNLIPEDTRDSSILYEPLSEFAPRVFPYLNFDKDNAKNKVQEVMEVSI